MKKTIPISDLERRAGQIVYNLADSDKSIVITQRGRPAAVLVSAARYSHQNAKRAHADDLDRMDDSGFRTMSFRQIL
ncbi:MAG: type II toxin-antitoxin system prevent-host-death family antitoxin [Blastocatellia bacterium]|nr:type II toxin-antitoxin system prevent-host-death family antitoxin [Blastocatellia bacterium]